MPKKLKLPRLLSSNKKVGIFLAEPPREGDPPVKGSIHLRHDGVLIFNELPPGQGK